MAMDDLEERFRALEKEAELHSQASPIVESVSKLTGWKKIAVVVVIGLVLFGLVRFLLNLATALISVGLLGLIVYALYKLFFQSSRSE